MSDRKTANSRRNNFSKNNFSKSKYNKTDKPYSGEKSGEDKKFYKDNKSGEDKKFYKDNKSGEGKKFYKDSKSGEDKKTYKGNKSGDGKKFYKDSKPGERKKFSKDTKFGDKKRSFKDSKAKDKKSFSKNAPQNDRKEFDQEEELDFLQIEGRNAILEALKSDKQIDKIFIKSSEEGVEGSLKVIKALALEKGIVVMEVLKQKLDKLSKTHNHQGVIAYTPAISYVSIEDILQNAKDKNEDPFVLILDGITDPHNLGAIIRSAECFGVHGVIIPKRHAVGISSIVSKTSAGALSFIPVCKETNLNQAIMELKKHGLWIGCADMDGEASYKSNLKGPLGLVVGSEGFGVSKLIKENCDFVVSIPMLGKLQSLNASVAAGVLMYEIVRQKDLV